MSEPWTPGPWWVDEDEFEVWDGHTHAGAPTAIALTEGSKDQRRANARLVALAPEMAELLRQIAHSDRTIWDLTTGNPVPDYEPDPLIVKYSQMARDLLARARGATA